VRSLPYDHDTASGRELIQLDGHRRELLEDGFKVFDNGDRGSDMDGKPEGE